MTCEKRPESGASGEPLVGSTEALDVLEALCRAGIDAAAAARCVGLDVPGLWQARPAPASALVRLLAEAARRSGDRWVGLHAAERAEPSGPLAHFLMSCAHLEDGLLRCSKFGPVIITTMRIDFQREGGHFALVYDLGRDELDARRQLMNFMLMSTARALRRAVGSNARFLEVHLRHAEEGGRGEIERAFGCPVRFEAPRNRLLIPSSVARRELRMSNPLIAEQMERFVAALLPRTPFPSGFAERTALVVRALIGSALRPQRKLVAKQLGVSERTLHRRLADEGESFHELRETVLWELAEVLVSDSVLKLEAVARSLGFGDAAAFSKAFKRRMGCPPIDYRRGASRATKPAAIDASVARA